MVMRHMKLASARFARSISLVTVIAGAAGLSPCAGSAHAQEFRTPEVVPALPEGMREPTNAALLYARALRLIGADAIQQVRDARSKGMAIREMPEIAALLENNSGNLALAIEATRLERCDWGVQYSKGPLALVDHAGPMRGIVIMLDARAAQLLDRSDVSGAVESIAAIFAIAEHISQDRIMISSLVSIAMTQTAIERIGTMLDLGKIDRANAESLLGAIERIERAGDFRLPEAFVTEKWMTVEWMRAAYSGPRAGAQLVQVLQAMVEDRGDAMKGLGLLDEAALAAQFDGIGRAYDDMIAAWSAPDAPEELDRIHEAVLAGEYGLIAQVFVPNFAKSRASVDRSNESFKAIVERLGQVK
ncbi:MAG: hypothetical protein KF912_11825 [Phycisphaeraceae bacterium]|nr:hypothetical protein [Phycisphaeraceae bacterium]